MAMDEEALIAEWERRCHVIGGVAQQLQDIRFEYDPPYTQKFPARRADRPGSVSKNRRPTRHRPSAMS